MARCGAASKNEDCSSQRDKRSIRGSHTDVMPPPAPTFNSIRQYGVRRYACPEVGRSSCERRSCLEAEGCESYGVRQPHQQFLCACLPSKRCASVIVMHRFTALIALAFLATAPACSSDEDSSSDAGSQGDGGARVDASASAVDAGDFDATPPDTCLGNTEGTCGDPALSCQSCPAGGPLANFLCSTACTSDNDCTDPARPTCNQADEGVEGFCAAEEFSCCWFCD